MERFDQLSDIVFGGDLVKVQHGKQLRKLTYFEISSDEEDPNVRYAVVDTYKAAQKSFTYDGPFGNKSEAAVTSFSHWQAYDEAYAESYFPAICYDGRYVQCQPFEKFSGAIEVRGLSTDLSVYMNCVSSYVLTYEDGLQRSDSVKDTAYAKKWLEPTEAVSTVTSEISTEVSVEVTTLVSSFLSTLVSSAISTYISTDIETGLTANVTSVISTEISTDYDERIETRISNGISTVISSYDVELHDIVLCTSTAEIILQNGNDTFNDPQHANKTFKGWRIGDELCSAGSKLVLDNDLTAIAKFNNNILLTLNTNVTDDVGILKIDDMLLRQKICVAEDVVSVDAQPVDSQKYKFSKWTFSESYLKPSTKRTTQLSIAEAQENDIFATANFAKQQYTLNASKVGSGDGSISPTNITREYGSIVKLNATPAKNSLFFGWRDDKGNVRASQEWNYELTSDANVSATFTARDKLHINVTSNPIGACAFSTTSEDVEYGSSLTIIVTPYDSYELTSILDNFTTESHTSNEYKLENITENHSLTFNFNELSYLVTDAKQYDNKHQGIKTNTNEPIKYKD